MAGAATAETLADMQLLLECLKCQLDNPASLRQALRTIAVMCSNTGTAKDHLRENSGLDFILELLISSSYSEVQEAAMYALGCAVDKNAPSQKFLTTPAMFAFLNKILVSTHSTTVQKQTSCFLVICLVANNSQGQMMVRKSGCLQTLMQLFKSVLPQNESAGDGWLDGNNGENLKLWSTITSAICVCVNNPQNDENQRVCASLLPHAFKYMQERSHQVTVVRPVASLIGLTVANNVHNQERVNKCGGVEALVLLLHHAVNRTVSAVTNSDSCSSSDPLQIAICVTSTIDAVISSNETNAAECVKNEVLPSLLKLLQTGLLSTESCLQVVMTIGHCVDSCVVGQLQLVENGGLSVLIKCLAETSDEELSSAIKYVLQACVSIDQRALMSRTTPQRQQMQPILSIARRELYHKKRAHQVMPSLKETGDGRLSVQEQVKEHDKVVVTQSPEESTHQGKKEFRPHNKLDVEIRSKLDELEKKLEESLSGQKQILTEMEQVKVVTTSPPPPSLSLLSPPPSLSAPPSVSEEEHQHLQHQLEMTKQALEQANKKKEEVERTMAVTLEIEKQHSAMQESEVATEEDEEEEEEDKEEVRESKLNGVQTPKNVDITCTSMRPRSSLSQNIQRDIRSRLTNVKTVCRDKKEESNSTPNRIQKTKMPTTRSCGVQTPDTPGIATLIRNSQTAALPPQLENSHDANKGTDDDVLEAGDCVSSSHKRLALVELTPCQGTGKFTDPSGEPVFVKPVTPPVRGQAAQQGSGDKRPVKKQKILPSRNTPVMSGHQAWRTSTVDKAPLEEVQVSTLQQHRPGMCGDGILRRTPRSSGTRVRPVCPPSPASSAESLFDSKLMHLSREPVMCDKYRARNPGKVEHWLRTQHTFPAAAVTCDGGENNHNSPNQNELSEDEASMCSEAIMSEAESIRSTESKARQRAGNSKCPGCQPRNVLHGPLLNSRTYNIALETSHFTCPVHRFIREKERHFLIELRKSAEHQERKRPFKRLTRGDTDMKEASKKQEDVYEFVSSDDSGAHGHDKRNADGLSMGSARTVSSVLTTPLHEAGHHKRQRRIRIPYSEQEVANLREGVKKIGKFWNQILWTYEFHTSRTAVDLKDKYKRLMLKEDASSVAPTVTVRTRQPFAMVEERRLRRGVRKYGYNWKLILSSFKFAEGRTSEQLRDKWRSSHKKSAS